MARRAIVLCSTPFGVTAISRYVDPPADDFRQGCSTPFGVTAISRRSEGELLRPPPVLNAFRRHGDQQQCTRGTGAPVGLCSTPFGVTAISRRSTAAGCSPPRSAQRLSASRRSA